MNKLAYRPAEAVEVSGLKRSQLYELLSSGEIESFKVGRARLIPADALADFLERRRAEVRA